jgi:hypothetical protein
MAARPIQIVGALSPPGALTHALDRRQQQRDQNADDGNHHKQFN